MKALICGEVILTQMARNKKYVLLIRKIGTNNGKYQLLEGTLQSGEDIYDTMIRELKTNLGIEASRDKLRIVHIFHNYNGEKMNFVFEMGAAKYKLKNGALSNGIEISWFPIDKIPMEASDRVKMIFGDLENTQFYDCL